MGPGLPCLSLAGASEPQGPSRCTCLPVDQGGRGGLERWAGASHDRLGGRARGETGEPARERVGQQSSLLLASHQAYLEHGWFLPHGREGVERGGGSCPPPMGELSVNLVVAFAMYVLCIHHLCIHHMGEPRPSYHIII